ncbi:MAG: hypothetical protein Ct9H300mP1_14100 [Planctomycetaceae bacterium]|nr:MAG: hypothetical protein Ct9H300mP1_14100 [Planctomycetaceae bacterium]
MLPANWPTLLPNWTGRSTRLTDYVTRVGVGHNAGSGVGYSEGFTTLEGLVPLIEDPERSLFFADLRMLLNNQATLGANLGLGHRVFDDDLGRTLGLFAWYDFRDTGNHQFHQLTLGFETLGEYLDFRSNVYIPNVSDRQKGLDNRFGAGHQLFVDRTEIAMTASTWKSAVRCWPWTGCEPGPLGAATISRRRKATASGLAGASRNRSHRQHRPQRLGPGRRPVRDDGQHRCDLPVPATSSPAGTGTGIPAGSLVPPPG